MLPIRYGPMNNPNPGYPYMSDFIEFESLQPNQYVKISGKYMPEKACFLAVEVVVEPADGEDKYEALLQEVQPDTRVVKLLGQTITLPNHLKIQDLNDSEVGIEHLKAGTMVKIKGHYRPDSGFKADKVKVKETLEFNIEELQGRVQRVDGENKQLYVNGVPIKINHKSILLKL